MEKGERSRGRDIHQGEQDKKDMKVIDVTNMDTLDMSASNGRRKTKNKKHFSSQKMKNQHCCEVK